MMGFYAVIWVTFVGFSESLVEFWEGWWGSPTIPQVGERSH